MKRSFAIIEGEIRALDEERNGIAKRRKLLDEEESILETRRKELVGERWATPEGQAAAAAATMANWKRMLPDYLYGVLVTEVPADSPVGPLTYFDMEYDLDGQELRHRIMSATLEITLGFQKLDKHIHYRRIMENDYQTPWDVRVPKHRGKWQTSAIPTFEAAWRECLRLNDEEVPRALVAIIEWCTNYDDEYDDEHLVRAEQWINESHEFLEKEWAKTV